MTYNFNLSYFDFSSDKDLGEISTTVYPDEWKNNLINYEFWESLIGILKIGIMDGEINEWVSYLEFLTFICLFSDDIDH